MQKKLINNFKLNLLENGYVVIKNLFIKSEVKDLLNSFEENIDYCNKTFNENKVLLNNIDQKYFYLKKRDNLLRSRSYDISKYHPALFQWQQKKIIKNYKINISRNIF